MNMFKVQMYLCIYLTKNIFIPIVKLLNSRIKPTFS